MNHVGSALPRSLSKKEKKKKEQPASYDRRNGPALTFEGCETANSSPFCSVLAGLPPPHNFSQPYGGDGLHHNLFADRDIYGLRGPFTTKTASWSIRRALF